MTESYLKQKNAITVFDIQRFSLHDGPGIRTTVFTKGCPLQCSWCQNPESHRTNPELAFYRERCDGCFECEKACSQNAIVKHVPSAVNPIEIDYDKCDACGLCAERCHSHALKLIGRRYQDDLLDEILQDKDFFLDSDGGVTFSGGEPTLYAKQLLTILPRLRGENIHVNIETSGYFSFKQMQALLPFLDLIYFDLKIIDSTQHKKHTGVDNKKILGNFARLSRSFDALQARIPVIPGINDNAENVKATARFLKEQGRLSIHCLPYHNFGEAKLCRINSQFKPLEITQNAERSLANVCQIFEQEGLHVVSYRA